MEWKLIWQIFWLFSRVAMFSWGGGPASLGLMQREVVSLGWLTPDEFADNIALSNVLPGPTAPKVSAYVGFKLAGWQGAFSAVAGTVIPTTLLMIVLIIAFFSIKDNPYTRAAIRGVRPLVVGFLVWSAYVIAIPVFGLDSQGFFSSILQHWDKWLIAIGTFAVLAFTSVNPFLLVVVAGIIGLIFFR